MFNENWYSEDMVKLLISSYVSIENIDGDVIEIGCWEDVRQTYKNGAIYKCPKVSTKKLNELLARIKANLFKLDQAPPSIPLGRIKMGNTCEFIKNRTCMNCKEIDCPSKYVEAVK